MKIITPKIAQEEKLSVQKKRENTKEKKTGKLELKTQSNVTYTNLKVLMTKPNVNGLKSLVEKNLIVFFKSTIMNCLQEI